MKDTISAKKLLYATIYSLHGLSAALQERAFLQEVAIFVILFFIGAVFCKVSTTLLLLSAWLFVIVIELINSAIEKCLDLITTEINPNVKTAKDMGSAAVFLGIVANFCLWLRLFLL